MYSSAARKVLRKPIRCEGWGSWRVLAIGTRDKEPLTAGFSSQTHTSNSCGLTTQRKPVVRKAKARGSGTDGHSGSLVFVRLGFFSARKRRLCPSIPGPTSLDIWRLEIQYSSHAKCH